MTIIHVADMPEAETARNHDAAAALEAGYAAVAEGNLQNALLHYRAALAAQPDSSEAWAALGQALSEAGQNTEAADALTTALSRDPKRSDLAILLAKVYWQLGRLTDAEDELRAFLRLTPQSFNVMQMLAVIIAEQSRYTEAADLGREACSLGTPSSDFTRQLCLWLTASGAHREAAERLNRHLLAQPDDAEAWGQLANLWRQLPEPEKARQAEHRYRILAPHGTALLDQTNGEAAPALSTAFIRALFDSEAERFEHDLGQRLRYQGPALLHGAISRVWNGDIPLGDTLDLGCGTGLAGRMFAPHSRSLTGLDLSPAMLSRAEKTGVYHHCVQGEAIDWLQQTNESFDLIIAADLLPYIGDLSPLFLGVHRVLRNNGLFALTAEQASNSDRDFFLHEKRRYAHGENYLLRLAEQCNFRLKAVDFGVLRYENGKTVDGVIVVFEK